MRPPRVRTKSFSPFVCRIYCEQFRAAFGLRLVWQPYPCSQPLCDFCPSDRRFASTFLQIPPRDGHPWCSAIPFPLPGGFGTSTRQTLPMPGAPKSAGQFSVKTDRRLNLNNLHFLSLSLIHAEDLRRISRQTSRTESAVISKQSKAY